MPFFDQPLRKRDLHPRTARLSSPPSGMGGLHRLLQTVLCPRPPGTSLTSSAPKKPWPKLHGVQGSAEESGCEDWAVHRANLRQRICTRVEEKGNRFITAS